MTLTNLLIVSYIAISIISASVGLYFSWNKFMKKVNETPDLLIFKKVYYEMPALIRAKKYVFNWYTIPVLVILFCVSCPLMFPWVAFHTTRKWLGIKTKSEIEAEKEKKEIDDAHERAKEWMKNEGEYSIHVDTDEIIQDSIPQKIKMEKLDYQGIENYLKKSKIAMDELERKLQLPKYIMVPNIYGNTSKPKVIVRKTYTWDYGLELNEPKLMYCVNKPTIYGQTIESKDINKAYKLDSKEDARLYFGKDGIYTTNERGGNAVYKQEFIYVW